MFGWQFIASLSQSAYAKKMNVTWFVIDLREKCLFTNDKANALDALQSLKLGD